MGESKTITHRELKLTAALYTHIPDLLAHVKATGRLPEEINPCPWLCMPLRQIIETRGTDITLNPDEQLIYDAIVREGRLPGGSACLVEPQERAKE